MTQVAPQPTSIPNFAPTFSQLTALPQAEQDAFSQIEAVLNDYGLGNLAQFAWDQVIQGASADQIVENLRQTPEYDQRFPGLTQMRQQGKGFSEAQWVSYEQTARGLFRQAGLPPTFGTNDQLAKYITNEVSPAELQQRINWATDSAYRNYDVAGGMQNGLSPGDFIGMELNPEIAQPVVEAKWRAAQAGTLAQNAGFGPLSLQQGQEATVNKPAETDLTTKFGQLAQQAQLFQPLVGNSGEHLITPDQQIMAAFQGNGPATLAIDQRKQERIAQFQGGGTFAQGTTGQKGFTGAG